MLAGTKSQLTVLQSSIDASVNFVSQQDVGYYESRYVRRVPDYFIAYLSSQTGCNRGCNFCHLTATGQIKSQDANKWDYVQQAEAVFRHYQSLNNPAKYVHYNFMARGEALANAHMVEDASEILNVLGSLAHHVYQLPSKFNISTILPLTLKRSLVDIFSYTQPTIYYSLYSTDPAFRKKWMPGAMKLDDALPLLKDYQQFNTKTIVIHFAMIEGENDSIDNMNDIIQALDKHELNVSFNIVRYNPADDTSRESSEEVIHRNAQFLQCYNNGSKVQIVNRVGMDVSASCGMFYNET